MAAEEIVPGVYGIAMSYVNAFLIAEGELTLIDSGLPRRHSAILGALSQMGRQPSDLKHIGVTHHHVDHTGSLAALASATGARIYVHPADAPIVRGEQEPPGPSPSGALGRLVAPIVARLAPSKAEPAQVHQEVQDGEELPIAGGLRVVHTPGHTPGHLAFLHQAKRVLFVGDAAANFFGRLGPPMGMYTQDMAQAKESLRKLAGLEFDVACFGHGRVLRGQANAEFRRLVERLAR